MTAWKIEEKAAREVEQIAFNTGIKEEVMRVLTELAKEYGIDKVILLIWMGWLKMN